MFGLGSGFQTLGEEFLYFLFGRYAGQVKTACSDGGNHSPNQSGAGDASAGVCSDVKTELIEKPNSRIRHGNWNRCHCFLPGPSYGPGFLRSGFFGTS